jgi:hypothetical protein
MVGSEGGGPDQVVRKNKSITRVIAQNKEYPIFMRELDLEERLDNIPWCVGDAVGLHSSKWSEANDSTITAMILQIIDVKEL